jgi:hypothetical protein
LLINGPAPSGVSLATSRRSMGLIGREAGKSNCETSPRVGARALGRAIWKYVVTRRPQ